MTAASPRQSPRGTVLVVDFGTALTTATLLGPGYRFEVKDPLQGARSWPSCVYLGADGVVGEFAEQERQDKPSQVIAEFKRDLGTQRTFGDQNLAAWQLVAQLLRAIKTEAQEMITELVDRLLITCPGDYRIGVADSRTGAVADSRWADLDRACREAGFLDIEYLHEPVAAVYAPVAGGPIDRDQVVLVYDFGGGTFDAALARIGPQRHEILGAGSIPFCGGADIDALLVEEIRRLADPGAGADPGLLDVWLKELAQDVKKQLSIAEDRPVRIGLAAKAHRVTRARLEQLVTDKGLVELTLGLVRELIDDAGVEPDVILVVGGTTRMPLVDKSLRELGYPLRRPIDIGCAVIDGAEAWARQADGRRSPPERFVLDAVPLRWDIPGGEATVSSWLARPGERVEAGDTVVRVSLLAGDLTGALWDLKADRPGILEAQHYRKDNLVRSADWLATLRPLPPDAADGTVLPRLWREIPCALTTAAVSADGHYAAVANQTTVTVYDLARWARAGSFTVAATVEQLVFTPAGELIAAAGRGFTAWDPASRTATWTFEDGRSDPRIAMSPDGQYFAVSSLSDRVVRFLSAGNRERFHAATLGVGPSNFRCEVSAYSADGSILVPATYDVKPPALATWDSGPTIVPVVQAVALAIQPEGNVIFSSVGARQITMHTKQDLTLRPASSVNAAANIRRLAFNPAGTLLACGLDNGGVELRRWAQGQLSGPIGTVRTGGDCLFVAFAGDRYNLITGNPQGLAIWSLADTLEPVAEVDS